MSKCIPKQADVQNEFKRYQNILWDFILFVIVYLAGGTIAIVCTWKLKRPCHLLRSAIHFITNVQVYVTLVHFGQINSKKCTFLRLKYAVKKKIPNSKCSQYIVNVYN